VTVKVTDHPAGHVGIATFEKSLIAEERYSFQEPDVLSMEPLAGFPGQTAHHVAVHVTVKPE